jgi:hypothetical protein
VDIDLVTVAVWGTAARVFLPDLLSAGRHTLGAAVRAGAHHIQQHHTPAVPTAGRPGHDSPAREGDVR